MDRHTRQAYSSNPERYYGSQPLSLAEIIIDEHPNMLESCTSEEAYRDNLRILIKCLCYEENRNRQGSIIRILCMLILQRCNFSTIDDGDYEDLIMKGSDLLIEASHHLEILLQRRIGKQRELTSLFMKFVSQHPLIK